MTSLRQLINRSRVRVFILLIAGIMLLVIGLASWSWEHRIPRQHVVRITGGTEKLNRHLVAKYLQRHAGEFGLKLEIVPSKGTLDATRMLEAGEVDLALLNGLIRNPGAKSVRQVAAISVEALHVLVKSELADAVKEDLSKLGELKIFLGPSGSETEMITLAILNFCGITPSATAFAETRFDTSEILSKLEGLSKAPSEQSSELRAAMPDAIFLVSTLPSPIAMQLARIGRFELLAMPFAEAFAQITVEEEDLDRDHIDQVHVVPTTIPAYMYGATPPLPNQELQTLGCPLILAAHKDVNADVVGRLIPSIFEGPVQRVYHPPSIQDMTATYPLHAASIHFRDRDKPLVREDVAEVIRLILSIVAPVCGGVLALYGYFRWRQTLRFLEYFDEFQILDRQAKGLVGDEIVTPAEADEVRILEAKLTVLQQRAVTDFCKNYFHGEGVLENFLQLLAETRAFLRSSI